VPAARRPLKSVAGRAGMLVPRLIAAAGEQAAKRFLEFFAATIRNKNTRQAYYRAVERFFAWCDHHRIGEIADIEPLHVAAYIEALGKDFEKPTVKQHLAAIRMLFDWLVTGQVVATNPAHSVRGPKHVVKTGKTTVLTGEQARELLDSIDTSTVVGLRDRALISVMTFAFARIGAAVAMPSRTTIPRASAGGSDCMRKAASAMRCRRITISKPTSMPTSRPPASATRPRAPSSAPPPAAPTC
jgi:integrase/recombinase XerD